MEIPLRTRLEKFISEQTKVKGGNGNRGGHKVGWDIQWCPSWPLVRGEAVTSLEEGV